MLAGAPAGGVLNYQTFQAATAPAAQQEPPVPAYTIANRPSESAARTEQSMPELHHSNSNSVQPSACTAAHHVSHHILEKVASNEDFEKGLHFQYVSKDLRACASQESSQQALTAGPPAAPKQAPCAQKFIETFNPHTGNKPVTNCYPVPAPGGLDGPEDAGHEPTDNLHDVYLRDTSQSVMCLDLDSDS
jgi:hypothetical protein